MLVLHPTDLLILAENLLFFLFCNMFLRRLWKNSLCFVVAMPVVWAVQYAIFLMIQGNGTLAYIALDLLCVPVLYKEPQGIGGACKKLFVCCVFHGVTGGIQALASNTVEWLSGEAIAPSRYRDPDIMLKVFLPYLLLSILALFALERFRAVDTAPLKAANWLMLLSMPVVSVAFLLHLTPYRQRTVEAETLQILGGLSLLVVLLNLFVFLVYRSTARAARDHFRLQSLRQHWQDQRRFVERDLAAQNRLYDIVHDILGHLQLVRVMCEEGRGCDAAQYLRKLTGEIEQNRVERYTENRDIDAVIAGIQQRMEGDGIRCEVKGFLPHTLPFDILDICMLVSNALNNACEACRRQGLTGDIVQVRFKYNGHFLSMTVTNPVDGAQEESNKKGPWHGRGRGIMERVAEAYEGLLDITIEDGSYILTAMLQVPLEKQGEENGAETK